MADQDQLTPLQQAEAELAKTEKSAVEAARIKARIADIKKTNGEVEAKKKEYKKAADGVVKKKQELEKYVATQKTMLEEVVDEAAITQIKDTARKELDDLAATAKAAAEAVDKPKSDTAAALADYTRLLTLHATILKDLEGLQKLAGEEYDADNLSRMYLVILFMEEQLGKLVPTEVAAYGTALDAAAASYVAAADKEREAKDNRDAAAAKDKALAKQLQDLRGNWRQIARERIEEGPGKVAAAAPEKPAQEQGQPGGYGGGGGPSPQPSTQS